MQKPQKDILTRNQQFNSPSADNTVFNKSALDDTLKENKKYILSTFCLSFSTFNIILKSQLSA